MDTETRQDILHTVEKLALVVLCFLGIRFGGLNADQVKAITQGVAPVVSAR